MLQSLQNKILFSQCQGLKQALVVVCHFLNVHQFWSGPLKDLPTKTRTQQFSGVSSSRCSHTFRALFNHAKFICHVLYVHLTLISAPCWVAKTDSRVNEGREHCMSHRIPIPETWLQALLPLHPAAMRMPWESLFAGYRVEHSQVFICFTHMFHD